MRLSDLSIRKPVFAWMLMSGLIIFGIICFFRMGISQLPDVDFPVATVSVTLEGAAPEIMETTVADPIESAVMTVQGVHSVSSTSSQGLTRVTVELELDRNIDVAVNEIQAKVEQAQRLLPKDIDPPIITKTNPDDQPIIWLAATSTNPDKSYLMSLARNILRDQFTVVEGVGDVQIGGYIDPNLRVWVDPDSLRKYNISVNDIINSIQFEHTELPGGQIQTADKTFNVRTLGEAKSAEEFGDITISQRVGGYTQNPLNVLRLKQVAKIEEGLADITRDSRFNGQFALGIGVLKQKGTNAVAVADRVRQKMEQIAPTLPKDVQLFVNFDSTRFIADAVHELNRTLAISALLTALACWIFLGSWTATLNVLLAIPTSVIGTFTALYFLGFTLNTFTLLALALSIGIVVDDAIMVLENIFRHHEEGTPRIEAAIIGAREITFAAMAASVAIIAIFLPVAFMKGVIGKYFYQFGVTMSIAVLLSLLEALTITPMRCASFVELGKRTTRLGKAFESGMAWTQKTYLKSLDIALQHRWWIMAFSVVFLVVSFSLVNFIGKEFAPAQDQSLFLIRFQTPVDSSLAFTDERARQAEEYLRQQPEIAQVYTAVGGFSGSTNQINSGIMFVTMKPKGQRGKNPAFGRELSEQEFMQMARKELAKIKDFHPALQDLSQRGFSTGRGLPIEFTVKGPDWDKLHDYTMQIMDQMKASNLMVDVDTNYLAGMPEVQITPDREQAAYRGVSVQAIGQTVNALIGGVKVAEYQKGAYRYDVRLQVQKNYDKVENIRKLLIGNNHGNLIPLASVVKQDIRPSLQQISRVDRQRAISVYSNVQPGVAQQDALQKVSEIAKSVLPSGYSLSLTGSALTFKESFDSLIFALILGIFVAYMVLASQFNSFIDPIIVLLALPFSLSGAFIALKLTGQTLNIYSMIGLILLMGIVKKNSILLVDFTNQVRDRGTTDAFEALKKACPMRLRPILMTSFAIIVGAIPEALSFGAGAETLRPMAVCVIGGVAVSTFLTLYVVPSAYLLATRLEKRTENNQAIQKAFDHLRGGRPTEIGP
jgi:HAE1 family hydrophobic/amphiphilic exporter-1